MAENQNKASALIVALFLSAIVHVLYFWFLAVVGDERVEPVKEKEHESVVQTNETSEVTTALPTRNEETPLPTRSSTLTEHSARSTTPRERTTRTVSSSEEITRVPAQSNTRPRQVQPRQVQQPATQVTSQTETETIQVPAVYVVKPGDTLTKIAKKYNTTPEELARINGKPVKKLNLLWVGQKIKMR